MTKKTFAAIGAVVLVAVVAAAVPYLLPTRIALGPCGRDWTSPSSYFPRSSPTRSVSFDLGAGAGKVCYGSPSARGREVFGSLVPWGELWRVGANEPTRLFVDRPVSFAGVSLPAGRYSIYARPRSDVWQIFLSASTFHWGNSISPAVRARELGNVEVPVSATREMAEQLTFEWESTGPARGKLVVEWERSRVEIPVSEG